MEAPAITRYRRPFFLAPLWLTLLAALVLGAVAFALYRGASTTVVVLVRAAEKDPGTIADPPISPEGEERAQRLARAFGDGLGGLGLDSIYVSDDRRAQQTAAPLAERLHRAPVVFAAADASSTAGRLLREHGGGTVLVVGGGDTVAQMLRALAGTEAAPVTDAAAVMYVVSVPSVGRAHAVRLRF